MAQDTVALAELDDELKSEYEAHRSGSRYQYGQRWSVMGVQRPTPPSKTRSPTKAQKVSGRLFVSIMLELQTLYNRIEEDGACQVPFTQLQFHLRLTLSGAYQRGDLWQATVQTTRTSFPCNEKKALCHTTGRTARDSTVTSATLCQ